MSYGNFNGGVQYANQQQTMMPRKWTNPLTKEQERLLKQNNESFNLAATPEEMARAVCTHRDPEKGLLTLHVNNDGTVTCTKCGSTFNFVTDKSKEEIDKILGAAVDIFESTKVMSLDAPDSFITSIYPIIPITSKFGGLYQTVATQWRKYGVENNIQNSATYGDPFSLLAGAVGGTMSMGMSPYGPQPAQMAQMYQNGWTGWGSPQGQPAMMNEPAGPGANYGTPPVNPWQNAWANGQGQPAMMNEPAGPGANYGTPPASQAQPKDDGSQQQNATVSKRFDI